MKTRVTGKLFGLACALSTVISVPAGAALVDIMFHTPTKVQGQDVWRFSNVVTIGGTQVNATLSVQPLGFPEQSAYSMPFSNSGGPNNSSQPVAGDYTTSARADFTFNYQWNRDQGVNKPGSDTGGYALTLSFFDGGAGDDGYSTLYEIEDFRLFFYDVDGDSWQSESARAYVEDGLVGYQIGAGVYGIKDTLEYDQNNKVVSVLYEGPGSDRTESSTEGAFILYYHRTSSITVDLFATTQSNSQVNTPGNYNGVFTAISGDLPNFPGWGNEDSWKPIEDVPEPSAALLSLLGAAFMLRRRR